ncbi:MAG: phasin family protein [Pseudoxanthomonas sp.]
MTTGKSTSTPRPRRRAGTDAHAETPAQSAQKIWLAGLGALGRAQAEGSQLFESLVREGIELRQSTRKLAAERADSVREAVQSHLEDARTRAAQTWDRLENVFEDQVQRALQRLKVPTQADLDAMAQTIATLQAQLHGGGRRKPASTARRPAADGADTPAGRAPRRRNAAAKGD